MGDCSRSNTGESGIISSWFGIHQTISHSFGDITVILELWGCSWGLSGFSSNKSRILTCLIGNLELLCTQCRGIERHLSQRWKSHGFSPVAVGNWGIFFSYAGNGHSKLMFFQGGWIGHLGILFTWTKKSQGPSHIHILEGRLLLSCLWKVGLSLQLKAGNQLSCPHDMVCMDLSSSCFTEIDVPLDLRWVSQGISGFS